MEFDKQVELIANYIFHNHNDKIIDDEMVVETAIKVMKEQVLEIRQLNESMGQMDVYIQKLEHKIQQLEDFSSRG